MLPLLSVVTSVKDYVDIVHTLMDHDPMWSEIMTTYVDPGAILTFCFLFCKELLIKIFTFGWLPNFATLPSLIPEVTRSMLTELSVFDTPALRFPNMFTFLDTPISYGPQNVVFYSLEKFIIGLINSVFFCLPTSFAHMVCMRRFVMQGVEAGYVAGLGTIAGNLVWVSCIVLGCRAIVIPWISLDVLRYTVGMALVFKYLWDSYRNRRLVFTRIDEFNAFVFNFCLAFLEQSMVFPFISNLSIGSDATLIESFPTGHIVSFFLVHFAYLGGLLLGSLTLLQGACWFWENPAFSLYMWTLSTFKMSALTYYRLSNFFFLYASMFFAMANLAYFGTDYLVTKPLGYLPNDRLITDDNPILETSYLGTKGSSRNTRLSEGRHNRRERWKRRHKKYRMFDTALYDDGIYDLFTIEDLNYGFHKFWLRRKMRNHRGNYRVLPAKQVRAFKQEAARSKLENFMGPRFEFTRMLFENVYHPTFHKYQTSQQPQTDASKVQPFNVLTGNQVTSAYAMDKKIQVTESLRHNNSALRKFVRKLKLRLKGMDAIDRAPPKEQATNPLYSKRWRHLFSRIYHRQLRRNTSVTQLTTRDALFFGEGTPDYEDSLIPLSERDRQLARYKSAIKGEWQNKMTPPSQNKALNAVHPLSFYLKREDAFKRKLQAYGPNVSREYQIGANLHAFSPMAQRLFYYHKPDNRWERGMTVARVTRKRIRSTRYQELDVTELSIFTKAEAWDAINLEERAKKNPNRFASSTDYVALIGKRAGRIRHQIFKDVLQHWYYSPYNRFLLQWDMDSFIRRQPRSYFMNKEDEKQLHLRRVLLNDYFQTFRWYSRMDQYHIMKQRIGGTKSFSSRVYNQQFQGTFKKVRHLFAVTPTLEAQPILKFDQPLFNEYPNTTNNPITAQSFIHEELNLEPKQNRGLSRELWDQAAMAVALALRNQENYRDMYTHFLTTVKNPTGRLSRFMLRGKKTQGVNAASGSSSHLLTQETASNIAENPTPNFDPRPYVDEVWLRLLDRAADTIYDEDVIKEAVEDYADEVYDEGVRHGELLDKKIERLKKWVVFMNTANPNQANLLGGLNQASSLAIKDVLYFQNDINKDRLNRRKNRPFYPDRYNKLKTVKKALKRRYQERFLDNLEAENFATGYTKKYNLNRTKGRTVRDALQADVPTTGFWANFLKPANKRLPLADPYPGIVDFIVRPVKTVILEVNARLIKPAFWLVTKPVRTLLRGPEDPDFYYWLKREDAYELEEDVLLEIDPLRHRMTRYLPWAARLAKWRAEDENRDMTRRIKKLLSTQEGRELYTAKGYAERKKRIEEETQERNKQIVANIPKEFQRDHIEDLKWVKWLAKQYRTQQKRDVVFFNDYIKQKIKAIDYYLKRKAKLENNQDFMTYQEIAEEQEILDEIKRDPMKWQMNHKLQRFTRKILEAQQRGDWKEANHLYIDRCKERWNWEANYKHFRRLYFKQKQDGFIKDPEVTMKVGVPIRLRGDVPWFSDKDRPPEGDVFEIKVPLTVYRIAGGDLTKKRDLYDQDRAQLAKRYRQWNRKRMKAVQAQFNEEFPSEEPPSIVDRITETLKGRVDIEEDPLATAIPVDMQYGTLSLADTNEEFIQERNTRKLELLEEYTAARKSGDAKARAKAKEMQEKVLRSLTGRPNLKLEDRFVPLKDDEPGQFEVEGELNTWDEQKWPLQAELEESVIFHPSTTQTEFERIADESYREAKRQDLHRWWYQDFLPKLRSQDYSQVYGRADRKMATALKTAGSKNLLEVSAQLQKTKLLSPRDYSQVGGLKFLGNRDYKPLQTPQGARVLSNVINRSYDEQKDRKQTLNRLEPIEPNTLMQATSGKLVTSPSGSPNPTQWVSSTPAPFYVGWDETARQFVVTNRYLSREQSGYQMNWNPNFPVFSPELDRSLSPDKSETMPFMKYPFKGLAATVTIYNKVYFASYDADQFFNLGLDGFTPVGWRKFKFRHTAPRVQPFLVHSVETSNDFSVFDKKRPFANLVQNYVTPSVTRVKVLEKQEQGFDLADETKEIESIHTHPQAPPYFPTGPLLNDILPVHYIFTLYQRYRLPREVYADIGENGVLEGEEEEQSRFNQPGEFSGGKMDDFTIRKRPMPQRRYHSKSRPLTDEELLPLRRAFRGARGDVRQRRPGTYPTEANLATRVKEANEGRVRTLRRRVLRKTQRPHLRYAPFVGGFVWPGDALHLEQMDGVLATTPEEREQLKQQAIAEGRPVPETLENPEDLESPLWHPQTRELFIAEHNKKVLKRRLERTQNKAQYYQKLKFERLRADNALFI